MPSIVSLPDAKPAAALEEYAIPESFAANAAVRNRQQYDDMYRRSLEEPEEFWGEIALQLHWNKPWSSPFMR